MAQRAFIRWMHFRDKVLVREISRRTGLSRSAIDRYLNSAALAPAYAKRQSSSALGPFAIELGRLAGCQ